MPGYFNQSILGFHDVVGGPNPPLNTVGDTIHIADFFMRTENDSSLIGRTVYPFMEGYNPSNGGIMWGLTDGITQVIPSQTFSCLYFVDYLAGDANGSGRVNGLDVTYLVAYLKGQGPTPDPLLSADANGDCAANVLDVTYLITYFEGGPPPQLGNCH
jgi:hypothetical protein